MKKEEKTAAIRKAANLVTNFVLLKQANRLSKAGGLPSEPPVPVAAAPKPAGGALANIMTALRRPPPKPATAPVRQPGGAREE